eukprot:595886_1
MASAPSQDDNLNGDEPENSVEESLEPSENVDSEGEEVNADWDDANDAHAQDNGAGINPKQQVPAVRQKRNRPAMSGASVANGLGSGFNSVSGPGNGLVGNAANRDLIVNNIYFSGPPREPPAKRRRMGGQHGWHLGLLGTLTAGTSAVAAGAFLGPHVIQAITLGSILATAPPC